MKTQIINFTKESISKLAPGEQLYSIIDRSIPHLRVLVYPSGVKTYTLCRKVNGKYDRIKIGRVEELTIEQVRKEAERLNAIIALGGDPQREKQEKRQGTTLKELYEYYYQQHALHFTKCPKENKRTLELNVFPIIGNWKAKDISPDKMRQLHAGWAQLTSPGNANRILGLVSPIFNFCIKNSFYNGTNPCSYVRKYRTKSRDRFLSQEELQKFFEAVSEEEEIFEHFFLMLLYTGARKSNVLSMKWSDINFSLKSWRIEESETKNRDVNIVYLSQEAIQILQLRLAANDNLENKSLFVFPGIGKKGFLNDPKKAFERVRKKMKVENFRMHDLRRTLGSYMAIGGSSLPIIGKALNHKSQVSTMIYARLSQEPVMDAINAAVTLIKNGKR